jgi:hypothetical protein
MQVPDFVPWILLICAAIAVVWWIGLWLYTAFVRKFYGRIAMNMDKIKARDKMEQVSKKERLMKLFFYRQITYEYSAYALLIICIGFLIASVYIFIKASNYIPQEIGGQPLNISQYLISVLSIRVGIFLVIFFICQVLLKLYRYCLKFTAFYTGLFDALFIFKDIDKNLEEAVQIFTIKEGLEKAPESPTEKVIEILKQVK